MKKNYFLPFVLGLAILVLAGFFFMRTNNQPQQQPTASAPETLPNENVIYNIGGVKVVTSSLPQVFAISPSGQQATEWSGVVQIFDGGAKPMNFTYEGDVVPFVETVTADSVVMPMATEHGVHDVYVADRHADGRLVTHYTFPKQRYLASTHDLKSFVVTDNKNVIIMSNDASSLKEVRRYSSPLAAQTWTGLMSPDDKQFAFISRAGTQEQPTFEVYVFGLSDGAVKKIGESQYSGDLVWKDAHTIGVDVKNPAQGTHEVKATFVTP